MYEISKKIVFECYEEFVSEIGLDVVPSEETEISRETGFDSLGFVTFVMALEEKGGVELDNHLQEIRAAKKMKDIIDILDKLELSV